ncbi:hypothetical protein RradSPS_2354 [Rubrobacter radiotolerans]|uniref:ASCH domain-containing protein n=1 Tax=Rubrobacter radiotolerans TaxID=42256 RepID=A0A023X5B0_RUBRA|nr:ASCH domain-containing protein [Rubrobacter radiotolerans]AHY47637.1 hypothetical protein RradSPS_2354 [Rubrobacter radiotolerans]MDX5895040.1 ASCH domain-containing protein [Rubrobacter radiotolerans]SMC07325.1 Uncharacterized protein YhfF [Rubrobacter radiotolerans DSM 5868]
MSGSAVERLWRGYLDTLPQDAPQRERGYLAEAFGDSPEMADRLAALILSGTKTATCSALPEYEAAGEPLPLVGDLLVVLDGREEPLCIVETTEVALRSFDEVDETFAREEGEGDRTLASWRREHERFFRRTLPRIGREFSPGIPLVCERFRLVYREREAPAVENPRS